MLKNREISFFEKSRFSGFLNYSSKSKLKKDCGYSAAYAFEKLLMCLDVVLLHFWDVFTYPRDGMNAATGVSYEKKTSLPSANEILDWLEPTWRSCIEWTCFVDSLNITDPEHNGCQCVPLCCLSPSIPIVIVIFGILKLANRFLLASLDVFYIILSCYLVLV